MRVIVKKTKPSEFSDWEYKKQRQRIEESHKGDWQEQKKKMEESIKEDVYKAKYTNHKKSNSIKIFI